MRYIRIVAAAALGAAALAACGSGATSSAGAKHQPAGAVATSASGVAVQRGATPLGTVLVSRSGLTIYALTKDTPTNSTCVGACAQAWPPVLVDKGWTVPKGLDRSLFTTIVRHDGTRQLVAGKWPLYTFSGDTKPGDVNGEGSGGVWFAVDTTAKLVKHAPLSTDTTMASSGY